MLKKRQTSYANSQQAELCSQIIAFLPTIFDGVGEAYKTFLLWQSLDLTMARGPKSMASYSVSSLNINIFPLIWLQDDNSDDCQ